MFYDCPLQPSLRDSQESLWNFSRLVQTAVLLVHPAGDARTQEPSIFIHLFHSLALETFILGKGCVWLAGVQSIQQNSSGLQNFLEVVVLIFVITNKGCPLCGRLFDSHL